MTMQPSSRVESKPPYNWHATEDERNAHYPCDDFSFTPTYDVFRAIDVAAPSWLVYRWLCQLRVAPYSYDVLDNPFRVSPHRLEEGLGVLHAGDRAMLVFSIAGFEWGHSLTLRMRSKIVRALFGDILGSYVVVPTAADASRIVAKARVRLPDNAYGRAVRASMLWIDYIMFRKQLLNLRSRAATSYREYLIMNDPRQR